jgi:hypothetical protein
MGMMRGRSRWWLGVVYKRRYMAIVAARSVVMYGTKYNPNGWMISQIHFGEKL